MTDNEPKGLEGNHNPQRNATDLFLLPSRENHHSESFWSSIFALSLLGGSRLPGGMLIPAFLYRHEGKEWYFEQNGFLRFETPLFWDQIVVEGKVRTGFLPDLCSPPTELWDIRPDILTRVGKHITIIEVKTVGHSLGLYQKMCCEKLAMWLRGQGYTVDLLYLISAGHESRQDWKLFRCAMGEQVHSRLLLWEVVFHVWRSHDYGRQFVDMIPEAAHFLADPRYYLRGTEV